MRYSGQTANPLVSDRTAEFESQNNGRFFAAALGELAKADLGGEARAYVGLIGQRDLPGIALRRAQATLRWDLRPSLWSHAFLILEPDGASVAAVRRAEVREVTLHSREGLFPEPADNAVLSGTLGLYDHPLIDANAAILAVGVSEKEAGEIRNRAIKEVNLDRQRFDLWETLGVWQTYLWSPGAPNPLREGFPVFSSAFVEYCFEAIELDLSPGASERNSAPEHLWNAARFWPQFFASADHRIGGRAVIRDPHCGVLDPEELRKRSVRRSDRLF
jgi:hypothetical protein